MLFSCKMPQRVWRSVRWEITILVWRSFTPVDIVLGHFFVEGLSHLDFGGSSRTWMGRIRKVGEEMERSQISNWIFGNVVFPMLRFLLNTVVRPHKDNAIAATTHSTLPTNGHCYQPRRMPLNPGLDCRFPLQTEDLSKEWRHCVYSA